MKVDTRLEPALIAGAKVSTVRQLVTPQHLLRRVTAVISVGTMTTLTRGSFVGGVTEGVIGLRATLWWAAWYRCSGLAWLLVSPIRRVRRMDALESEYGNP